MTNQNNYLVDFRTNLNVFGAVYINAKNYSEAKEKATQKLKSELNQVACGVEIGGEDNIVLLKMKSISKVNLLDAMSLEEETTSDLNPQHQEQSN